MAGYNSGWPPGANTNSSEVTEFLDSVQDAADTIDATNNQTLASQVALPIANASHGIDTQCAQTAELVAITARSEADSPDRTRETDRVLFEPFKFLPLEVRAMIWLIAAEAARPNGVYQFRFARLWLVADGLAQTVFTHVHRLSPGAPSREIFDLIRRSHLGGQSILTFTPFREVGMFTLEMRNLFRSCSEARSELTRTPGFSSSFNFHWMDGIKCNLGTIRPFHYDTDWISIWGLPYQTHNTRLSPDLLCTPDISRIQHLALPCVDYGRRSDIPDPMKTLHILLRLDGLKSLGLYESTFTIRNVSRWRKPITENQKLFLKVLPIVAPEADSLNRLTSRSFRAAMKRMKAFIGDTCVMANVKRVENWHPSSMDIAGLRFCFLVHGESEDGLDLTGFREDGSHLDNVDRIEDLGSLRRAVKRLQLAAA